MMFNNKFNSDGTIHFDVNEWTNTDPDNWQNKQNIVAKETKETKIKVDSDAEILDEIPADVLANITEMLQTSISAPPASEDKSDGNG